jgi:hypothetical protein
MPCQILALSLLLPRFQRRCFNACSFEHCTVCYKYRPCCCHAFRRPLARVHSLLILFMILTLSDMENSTTFSLPYTSVARCRFCSNSATLVCNDFISMPCQILDLSLLLPRLQRLYFNALSGPSPVPSPSSTLLSATDSAELALSFILLSFSRRFSRYIFEIAFFMFA